MCRYSCTSEWFALFPPPFLRARLRIRMGQRHHHRDKAVQHQKHSHGQNRAGHPTRGETFSDKRHQHAGYSQKKNSPPFPPGRCRAKTPDTVSPGHKKRVDGRIDFFVYLNQSHGGLIELCLCMMVLTLTRKQEVSLSPHMRGKRCPKVTEHDSLFFIPAYTEGRNSPPLPTIT